MIPKNEYLAGVLLAGLSCVSLVGQENRSGDQLVAPHWQFNAESIMQPGKRVHAGEAIAQKGDGYSYKAMPLNQAFIRVPAVPSYFNPSDGVLASSIQILPKTEAAFHIEFAKEKTVQVPSRVVLAQNTGVIEYRLHNCQVLLIEWPKRR